MFICFEILILCLCFDVKIAFPSNRIGNVHIAISLRVIVIFVEYDFIYRCHYAVATLLFSVAVQCKLAFHHFSRVDSNAAHTHRLPIERDRRARD